MYTLNIQIKNISPLLIVTLEGKLAQLEVYKVKNKAEEQIHNGCRFAILDLRQVSMIDSAGIGAVTHLRNECTKLGGMFALVVGSGSIVMRALTTARLTELIPCYEDVEEARLEIVKRNGLANVTLHDLETKVGGTVLDLDAPVEQVKPSLGQKVIVDDLSQEILKQMSAMSSQMRMINQRLAEIERAVLR